MLQKRQMRTAEELKLPQKAVDALIAIRDDLRDGKYPHRDARIDDWAPVHHGYNPLLPPDTPVYFNMAHWHVQSRAGRICCIGALVEQRTGYRLGYPDVLGEFDFHQHQLCYPNGQPDRQQITDMQVRIYNTITPDQAADAIDNFLYEGQPHWGRILPPA